MSRDAKDKSAVAAELEELRGRIKVLEAEIAERVVTDFEQAMNRALLDNISDLAYLCDDNGNIIYVNHVFEALSGHKPDEFIGKSFAALFSPEDLVIANEAYSATLRGESPVYELTFLGTGKLCEYHNHPFRDKQGQIIGVLGMARDITERKKAFDKIEKGDYFLRESQKVARLGSYSLDIASGLWTSSEVMDEIFGIDSSFMRTVEGWSRLLHPDDRVRMLEYFERHVLAGRNDFDMEYRIVRHSDRSVRWVHGRGKLFFDEGGSPVRMIGTIQDITEKKKFEEMLIVANLRLEEVVKERTRTLSESEVRFRALVDTIPYGIHEIDTAGVITFCNRGCERMLGYDKGGMNGISLFDLLETDEDRERLRAFLKNVVAERPEPTSYFSRARKKDGTLIDTRVDWDYKYSSSGVLAGFIAVITDITEQKRADEALRGSEARLNEAQKVARMGSYTFDFQANTGEPSLELLRIFDVSIEDYQKDPYGVVVRVTHPEDREAARSVLNSTIASRKQHYVNDYRLLLKDGTVKSVHSEARITYGPDGKPSIMVGTVQDVTERKQAELEKERLQVQLLHAQKMEAIGTMAGGVAHDFNNIITVISSLTELMLQKTGQSDPFYKYLQPINESCRRAVNLVQQLILFSSSRPKKMSAFNLNELATELRGFFEHLLSEDITVEMDLKRGLWEVNADRVRMEQVLTNMVFNASEAMPDGGTVTVRTKNSEVNEDECACIPGCSPGRYVCLIVEDTGAGIDPEVKKHIFEPFFTTKKGRNSGMGLAVVYGVIKDHGGCVQVESSPGAGAVFKVFLPAAAAAAETCRQELTKKTSAGCGKRILLVEDDLLVRKSAAMVLEDSGYVVYEAPDAESAIRIFNREKGVFDLVLSDVVMPGKSGLQMIEPLLEINPGVPVLLCSGYLDDKAQITEIVKRGYAFIQKPYDVSELLSAVEETIAQHRSMPDDKD